MWLYYPAHVRWRCVFAESMCAIYQRHKARDIVRAEQRQQRAREGKGAEAAKGKNTRRGKDEPKGKGKGAQTRQGGKWR